MWRIWKSRNELLFNNKRIDPQHDIDITRSEVNDWISNNKPIETIALNRSERWSRPPADWLKCNYDATFNPLTNQAYGGWLVRNHMGIPQFWGTSNLKYTQTPLEAETKALLVALQMVWCKGYKKIIFEGDCQVLVNLINEDHEDIYVLNICRDIKLWMQKFEDIHIKHVLRSNNEAAHLLAKHRPSNDLFFSNCIYPPVWLTHRLYLDFMFS